MNLAEARVDGGTLLALIGFFVGLVLVLRRFARPHLTSSWVPEHPPLRSGLAELVVALGRWKEQGRIDEADYRRLMELCEEDAAARRQAEHGEVG